MKYYKTNPNHRAPTVAIDGNLGIADPCHIIPDDDWGSFLDHLYERFTDEYREAVIIWKNVPFHVRALGGDGTYKGVGIDSGQVCRFDLGLAKQHLNLTLHDL